MMLMNNVFSGFKIQASNAISEMQGMQEMMKTINPEMMKKIEEMEKNPEMMKKIAKGLGIQDSKIAQMTENPETMKNIMNQDIMGQMPGMMGQMAQGLMGQGLMQSLWPTIKQSIKYTFGIRSIIIGLFSHFTPWYVSFLFTPFVLYFINLNNINKILQNMCNKINQKNGFTKIISSVLNFLIWVLSKTNNTIDKVFDYLSTKTCELIEKEFFNNNKEIEQQEELTKKKEEKQQELSNAVNNKASEELTKPNSNQEIVRKETENTSKPVIFTIFVTVMFGMFLTAQFI